MNRITLTLIALLTLFLLAACGGDAPQTQPEIAAATEAPSQPTAIPAPTETAALATEAGTESAPAATEAQAASGVSFANDIMPILDAKCINCHGGERIREGLDMRTYEYLFAGSDNGSVITPGNANDSLFVQLIVEGEMPSRGTRVTPEELQIIIQWVNQGALNN